MEKILIRNAHIKTMAGPELENGCLLIEDGKIAAVAPVIDAPADARVIDAEGRLVTPGCVEGTEQPKISHRTEKEGEAPQPSLPADSAS